MTGRRETVHIKLDQPPLASLRSDGKKAELLKRMRLFHFVLHSFDSDWPYVSSSGHFSYYKGKTCLKCGGAVYANPMITPPQIKALARQLRVPVKIMRFALEKRCETNK